MLSAAAQFLHQCHLNMLKSMPFDCIYGFHKLEQGETCFIQWFHSLRKFAVRVYAGGLNI